jgi:protein-S-isoprenylcysteine O-methyltransferase Ste14
MKGRIGPIVGSIVFFAIAPGTIAGVIPYALTGWTPGAASSVVPAVPAAGIVLCAAGLALILDCFARFALQGRGTPAPIAPTEHLVISGAYRYVRNPMYVAVLSIVAGQALFFGSTRLIVYAAILWLAFHLFVRLYEEPTLRARYGASYDRYCQEVRRWWPGVRN